MLLSRGEIGEPCGVPFRSLRARFVRRLPPSPSSSSTGHFQPRLDQSEHPPVTDASGQALHQLGMGNLAEVVGQIAVNNLVVPRIHEAVDAFHRVVGAPSRSVGVLLRLQVGLEYRRQHEHRRRLRHPVPDAGNAQRPRLAGLFLRDQDLPHRLRCVAPVLQIPRQFPEPATHAVCLDVREALSVYPDRAAVPANLPPGFLQEVLSPHLVDQRMEPPSGFFLSFRM